jgi:GNAT superfamily N-acetyltransferase
MRRNPMLDVAATLRLRPFALADAGAVEPWLAGPGLSVPGGHLRREWPQRLLADSRIVALVAEAGGTRIGLVRLDCGPDRIAEVTLVVAPQCRRHGFGAAMFRFALQQARWLRLRQLIACIDLNNRPALGFFADMGFSPDGTVGNRVRMTRLVHAGDHQPPLDID